MPAISIIIPVYNVEPYLRECLDSVVNQTFRDIEIICVNDGSTDGSPAILEEYAAKDSRIQIVNKENGGLNSARNAGLDRVTGEYFAILDSDDWLDLTAYEKAYARAKESDADMTQFYFKFIGFPDDIKDRALPDIPEAVNQADRIQWNINNTSVCWCYLWKTAFVKKNQLRFYNELLSNTELPFTYKAAVLANKIAFLPERLSYYRYRNNSLTGNKKNSRFIQRPLAFKLLFRDLEGCNVSEESWLLLYQFKWKNLYETYYFIIDNSRRTEMGRLIKQYLTDDERKFMVANEKLFDPEYFKLFVKHSGLTLFRWKYNCKIYKGKVFDWFAKRLIPYSPWLQHTLEIVDSQREQIEIMQEQLEDQNDK